MPNQLKNYLQSRDAELEEEWKLLFVDYGTAPLSSIEDYGRLRMKAFSTETSRGVVDLIKEWAGANRIDVYDGGEALVEGGDYVKVSDLLKFLEEGI